MTALLSMNVLQESKQVSFCVYVCACMCRNETKVLMKAQGSSAVGFKIITSVHKGNSSLSLSLYISLSLCVLAWLLGFASFLCKSKSPIPSCVFFLLHDVCCILFIIYLLFFPSSFSFLSSTSPALLHLSHSLLLSSDPFIIPHCSSWLTICLFPSLFVILSFSVSAVFFLFVAYHLNYLCLLIFRSGKKCRRVKELKMTGVAWMEGCEEMSAEIPLLCLQRLPERIS